MDKHTRKLTREFAMSNIRSLELLTNALEIADHFEAEISSRDALLSQYSSEMQSAKEIIQSKEKIIKGLRDDREAYEDHWEQKKIILQEKNDEITKLKTKLSIYEHELPLSAPCGKSETQPSNETD
jgi:chromosome segregation ATPase